MRETCIAARRRSQWQAFLRRKSGCQGEPLHGAAGFLALICLESFAAVAIDGFL